MFRVSYLHASLSRKGVCWLFYSVCNGNITSQTGTMIFHTHFTWIEQIKFVIDFMRSYGESILHVKITWAFHMKFILRTFKVTITLISCKYNVKLDSHENSLNNICQCMNFYDDNRISHHANFVSRKRKKYRECKLEEIDWPSNNRNIKIIKIRKTERRPQKDHLDITPNGPNTPQPVELMWTHDSYWTTTSTVFAVKDNTMA